MFLTRDQKIALDVARTSGFNPSNIITLCSKHSQYKCSVLSINATQNGERFNLRIAVNKVDGTLLSADKLTTVFRHQSPNDNECVIDRVDRSPVFLKE